MKNSFDPRGKRSIFLTLRIGLTLLVTSGGSALGAQDFLGEIRKEPSVAVLYVSSETPDTDFTVKLVDVYPDGTAYNIQEAAKRMRYREGLSRAVFMEPDEVYEIRFDLHATSNYFGPGHRIRLEVSSSNFPRWSRNFNTGGNNYDETEWVVTQNTIHHSQRYPSHVLLPVIR